MLIVNVLAVIGAVAIVVTALVGAALVGASLVVKYANQLAKITTILFEES